MRFATNYDQPDDVSRQEAALRWAITIIENYQMDIRQRGLDKEGFCQGVVYQEAIPELKKALGGEPRVLNVHVHLNSLMGPSKEDSERFATEVASAVRRHIRHA